MEHGKKKFVSLIAAAGLLAACAGAATPLSARANSAPVYWEGVNGTGPVLIGDACPVEIASEKLTLEIPDLPATHYDSQEQFEEYRACVTAEYAFFNPTQTDIAMMLIFPFGARPDYAYDAFGAEGSAQDDTARYRITADGQDVQREIRYTLHSFDAAFQIDLTDLISDEKRTDRFPAADTPITEYRVLAEFPQTKRGRDTMLFVELSYNPIRTRIFADGFQTCFEENGNLLIGYDLPEEGSNEFVFFAAGAQPKIKAELAQGDGFYGEDRIPAEGAAPVVQTEDLGNFEEYTERFRPAHVGEVDFYNAVSDEIDRRTNGYGFCSFDPATLSEMKFDRWYRYSLTVPAGGTVVNRVTAPLYPDIIGNTYRYEYLLSPAWQWADFGTLEIAVETPYTLEDCSLDLQQTSTGYALQRDGLPLSELTFSIRYGNSSPNEGGLFYFAWGLVILLAIPAASLIAGVTIAIVFGVRAHKNKKKKNAKKSP